MAPYMNGSAPGETDEKPPKPSGIHAVIVGAGFAGLAAAIECRRRGHSCVVLESYKHTNVQLGDIISMKSRGSTGASSSELTSMLTRLRFQQWSYLRAMAWHSREAPPNLPCERQHSVQNVEGRGHLSTVLGQRGGKLREEVQWTSVRRVFRPVSSDLNLKYILTVVPSCSARGEIHKILFDHALSVGVDIRLGQKVTEYFEDDSGAGVVSNGERVTGDVVLGCDGVRSKARTLVLGYDDKPKPSGYAVYRAWLDSSELAKDPLTKDLVINGDTHTGWLGPDIHFLAASIKNGKEFSWVCTHKDERDVDEGWSEPGNHEDACRVLEGWAPEVHAIVRMTPPEKLVDWKLVCTYAVLAAPNTTCLLTWLSDSDRDPLPTWVSPKGRIALVGDAAHPFLPTSIQGASQALESSVTVAVCLELAGKEHVPDALRAYEKIRYDRVRAIQKTGETSE